MGNDDNIVVEPRKPGQILYADADFVKFMNSPRFASFIQQAEDLLKDNTFLYDEKIVVQGADNSVRVASSKSSGGEKGEEDGEKKESDEAAGEEENQVLDLMSSVASAALGVVLGDKEKDDDAEEAEADGDEDGDKDDDKADGDDEEEMTEEEESELKEIATPIIAAMSKSLIRSTTGMVNRNSKTIVEKLTPMIKDLRPFFEALKPGIKYIQGPVETVLAPLNTCLKKYGVDVDQIKTDLTPVCQALAVTTMMGGSSRVAQLRYDYRTRFRDLPDLDSLWDPRIPVEKRVPKNEGDPGQKEVFEHMASHRRPEEKLNKIDCLNQLILNLNALKEPIKSEEMDEEFVLRQVNRRYQAFKNLNYLYFKFNALTSDTTDPENVRNSANYNQTTYRWTQDGRELFFVVGKFLQDAFNYNEISVDDERLAFDNAKRWYDNAKDELFREYGRQFFEGKFTKYKFDPDIFKQTADVSYEKPETEAEWDTPDKKRPKNLDAFGDNWEITVPDMIHHPELFIDDEVEVDDPDAPGGKRKEAVPCGMTMLITQIDRCIEAENAMFADITKKTRENVTARMNDTIAIRQGLEKQTFEAADKEQQEIAKRLDEHSARHDFTNLEEQTRFDRRVENFKASLGALKDSDAKKELEGFLENQPDDRDFFASDDERYFEEKKSAFRALSEEQQKKIDGLKAQIQEKDDLIGKLDDRMNETRIKNEELTKKIEHVDRASKELYDFLQREGGNRNNFDYRDFPDSVLNLTGLPTLKKTLSEGDAPLQKELYRVMFAENPMTGVTNQAKLTEAAGKLDRAVKSFKKLLGEDAEEVFVTNATLRLLDRMQYVRNPEKPEEAWKAPALLNELGDQLMINQSMIGTFKDEYVRNYDFFEKRDGNVNAFLPKKVQGSPELSALLEAVNEYSDAIKPFRNTLVRKEKISQEITYVTEKAFEAIHEKISSLDEQKKNWNAEIAENKAEELRRADSDEMHQVKKDLEKARADKKELEDSLAARNAELECMKEVNALLTEGGKLIRTKKEKDPDFADKKRYAELSGKKAASRKAMDRIQTEEEKKTEPLLSEEKIRGAINAAAEKHNAKLEKLNGAKKEYQNMKAGIQKFWDAEKKLSRTGIALGKARIQLDRKAEAVEAVARINRPNKQVMKDFDDRQRDIMRDLLDTKDKKFMGFLFGNSSRFEKLETALTAFMETKYAEAGSRTDFVLSKESWDQATEPLMKALKDYIEDHDVSAPGKTKWTNNGQQRLDYAKQLKQIIEARSRTLEADSAELERLRSMKNSYVKAANIPEALVQLTVQKNRDIPAVSLPDASFFLKNPGVYGIKDNVYDPKKNIAGKAAVKLDDMINERHSGKKPVQQEKKREEPEKVQEQPSAVLEGSRK